MNNSRKQQFARAVTTEAEKQTVKQIT